MNNINILGTMVKDVELKFLPSGLAVGNFSIAVNQDYKKQDGTKVEKTSFFEVKTIGKQSEIINQYFSKGSRIGITGLLEQETWTTQDGSNRSKVIIKLEQFSFIDRKSDSQAQKPQEQRQKQQSSYSVPEIEIDMDSEVPF